MVMERPNKQEVDQASIWSCTGMWAQREKGYMNFP